MKLKWTVRLKLVVIVLSLGAVFFAAILLAVFYDYKNFILKKTARDLDLVSELIARRVEADILYVKNHLMFVASNTARLKDAVEQANASYAAYSQEEIASLLKKNDAGWDKGVWEKMERSLSQSPAADFLKDLGRISRIPLAEIFVADIKGGLVATVGKTEDFNQSDEVWWQSIYKGGIGSFYLSPAQYDESAGVLSLTVSCPIVDAHGMVIGVLKAVLNNELFFKNIFNIYLGRGSYAGIMTSQAVNIYTLLANRIPSQVFLKSMFDFLVTDTNRDGKVMAIPNIGKFIVGYDELEGVAFDRTGRWYVYSAIDLREAYAPLRAAGSRLLLLWFVVMGCLYGFIAIIARRFVEPLEVFKKGCEDVKRGVLGPDLEISSGDEFEELAQDFNSMVGDLRQNMVSKDYFNKIIQNMSDILFVINPYGNIDLANKRTCELLGYREEELKGKNAADLFAKKDRYVISWGLRGLIEEGALKDKKINLISREGKEIEVYLGTRSIKDANGNLVGLVCLAKDMTLIGRLLSDLQKSNEEIQRHKQDLERSLKELTENRDVMLSILEDTDESKKQLEETLRKLREAQNELLQAEKMISLGQIAAGVAHEINNPLFVISGEAEMLHMEENLSVSAKESLGIIREQVGRIGDIIKRLLEFSRKKETKFVLLDINDLVRRSVELLKYQAKALGRVEIVNRLSALPMYVRGDQNQLHEVFINIMLNAIQAMEEKGGTLTLSSSSEIIPASAGPEEAKFKAGDRVALIRLKDTGVGIDEETKRRIFDPFFTTKKTGTGLGLSVCFGIVENHDGTIEVESAPDVGTTFIVKLPIVKEDGKKKQKAGA